MSSSDSWIPRLWSGLILVLKSPWIFWQHLRAWRRFYFTRAGVLFVAGAFGVGFAAMNTGNNLLFLILGAMLGSIVLSSWLSEQTIREIRIRRHPVRPVTVGKPVRIEYDVENRKRVIPSLGVDIGEEGLPSRAYFPRIDAGETVSGRSEHYFVRRGVYPLDSVTISTGFPFGLFRKERDVSVPGELVIWPRCDRDVPQVSAEGERGVQQAVGRRGHAGSRGEYRGLRGYRAGDDPRDIHWKSTARLGEPVIRQYERDGSESLWICLDTRGDDEEEIELAVEVAASLAARFERAGRKFALTTPDRQVDPAEGVGQLERVLDQLARVEFSPDAPRVNAPVEPRRCVLVSLSGRGGEAFGDVVRPGRPSASTGTVPGGPERDRGWRGALEGALP